MDHPKLYVAGGLGFWIFWASLFILRSPGNAFTHDFRGHLQNTQILYHQHRLPLPYEGLETYQPPFYYLVNSLLFPDDPHHVLYVRLLSLIYGGAALLLMSRWLTRCRVPLKTQMVVLFFVATTPAFLFLFTTYNNDSLATLLSVGILVVAGEWIFQGNSWLVSLLGALTVLGLYTKLTVLAPVAALALLLFVLGWRHKMFWDRILPALGALGIGALFLVPWLLGHNLRTTGRLTPNMADFPLADELRLKTTPLRTFLTPPGGGHEEWKDPYVNIWGRTRHKKNSYTDYLFVTSIFGEYTFQFLPPIIPWMIFIVHVFLGLAVWPLAGRSPEGKLSLFFIMAGFLLLPALFFRAPYVTLMDFRYIAWVWLPAATLLAISLLSVTAAPRAFSLASMAKAVMVSGTVLHGLLWVALILGGQWNWR